MAYHEAIAFLKELSYIGFDRSFRCRFGCKSEPQKTEIEGYGFLFECPDCKESWHPHAGDINYVARRAKEIIKNIKDESKNG